MGVARQLRRRHRCETAWSTEGSGVAGSWGVSGMRVGDDARERQRPRRRGSSLLSGEVHVLFLRHWGLLKGFKAER